MIKPKPTKRPQSDYGSQKNWPRVAIQLPVELLARIDAYRAQTRVFGRSMAFKEIIEKGLAAK